MKDKIMLVYNTTIIISIIVILLSVFQLAFNVINIPTEFSMAIGIYTSIGLASFLIDRYNYKKQNK